MDLREHESCHTYGWVMSHIWMSHVTHVNDSYHTYGWVISHMCMDHVTHMDGLCHKYEWIKSHTCLSHVTDALCAYSPVFTKSTIHTVENRHMCTQKIPLYMHSKEHESCYASVILPAKYWCVTWLIYTCDMTRPYVRHDSFIHVTWLTRKLSTNSRVRHDSLKYVTRLIYMCYMTHSYM